MRLVALVTNRILFTRFRNFVGTTSACQWQEQAGLVDVTLRSEMPQMSTLQTMQL